ncbi:MAG: histidine kinase [bacterium]
MAIALIVALVLVAHLAWRVRTLSSQVAHERLTILSMELRPHFLLNALNAAAELVHADPDAADGTITALGHLLSHSLRHHAHHEITLGEEIALLRDYAAVERARFGGGLHVEIDAPVTLHGASVPPLLLQPLVENAVRHGIGPTGMCGTVRITARRQGPWLHLQVKDRGVGFVASTPRNGGGVGLANVRARLNALYGRNQALEITSKPGEGTLVTIMTPWREMRTPAEYPPAPVREVLALVR